MSAPFVIPFNNCPVSVSVITTSYTIPLGKFARIVVNLEGSATFTINGVTALRATQNSVLGSDNLRLGRHAQDGTGQPDLDNVLLTSASKTGVLYSFQAVGSAFNETIDQKTLTQEVWVPSGSVVSGTGVFRIIVSQYNAIT